MGKYVKREDVLKKLKDVYKMMTKQKVLPFYLQKTPPFCLQSTPRGTQVFDKTGDFL